MIYGKLQYNKLTDRYNLVDDEVENNILDLDIYTYLEVYINECWEQMQISRAEDNKWVLISVSTFIDLITITELEGLEVRSTLPLMRK